MSQMDITQGQASNLPPYPMWRENLSREVLLYKHSGKTNVWRVGPYSFCDSTGHALSHLGPVLLEEVLKKVDMSNVGPNGFIEQTISFSSPVGYKECVETGDDDSIIFMKRPGRMKQTRFVLNRHPQPSNLVFIVLKRDRKKHSLFYIVTAYVGGRSGREPWDKWATNDDNEFWKKHALVSPTNISKDDDVGDEGYWQKVISECIKYYLSNLLS